MNQPAQPPDIRWSPTSGLCVAIQGGRFRFLDLTEHDPIAPPDDAVRLAETPAVVYVVEHEESGVLFAAYSEVRARDWIASDEASAYSRTELSVTAVAADRG